MIEKAEVVVIGAGFAGASTAYHLVRQGVRDVLVLEAEDLPGVHASGRNAAMARQTIEDAAITTLAVEGTRFLQSPPEDWQGNGVIRNNGSLLLAEGQERKSLEKIRDNCAGLGVEVEIVSPEEAARRVPVLGGAEFERAAWCPSDGLVDIHALLLGYLAGVRKGGGRVQFGRRVTAVRSQGERVTGVDTVQGVVEAPWVVDAAGPWSSDLVVQSRLPGLPVRSFRRHLFVTTVMPWVDPGWPFVWDITHSLYFRPEAKALLMSPCDQQEMPASNVAEDPAQKELLAERVVRYLPGISEVPVRMGWAGLRTFAPDKRFLIGLDPEIDGLVWVTALGGHGMTTSAAVGRLGAAAITGRGMSEGPGPFSPARFR